MPERRSIFRRQHNQGPITRFKKQWYSTRGLINVRAPLKFLKKSLRVERNGMVSVIHRHNAVLGPRCLRDNIPLKRAQNVVEKGAVD